MPADAPQRPEKAPRSAADAPAWATLPAGPRRPSERRFRSLGAPPKAGGVRGGPGDGPERLRNVGVAKIPELDM